MILLPSFRALHIAATVLIGGAFAFEYLIFRRIAPADRANALPIARWLRTQCITGLILGLISWAGWLAAIAIEMSGESLQAGVLATVVEQTTFGHVWALRTVLFVLLAGLMVRTHALPTRAHPAAAVIAVALVGSLAWTGHALATSAVHVWVDAMHLLAATVWLGMLPALWLIARRAASHGGSEFETLAAACAKEFFWPGLVAVVVLAGSGIANTSWMMDSPADFVRTDYGRVLGIKLILVAAMIVLAGVNRFVIVPRLARNGDAPLRLLGRSVFIELLLGAAIVVVVAWLGVTPPAAHERVMDQMEGM